MHNIKNCCVHNIGYKNDFEMNYSECTCSKFGNFCSSIFNFYFQNSNINRKYKTIVLYDRSIGNTAPHSLETEALFFHSPAVAVSHNVYRSASKLRIF